MEMIKGWRTIIFNVVMAGVVILTSVFGADIDQELVSENLDAIDAGLSALLVLGNLFLRAITSSRVGSKY